MADRLKRDGVGSHMLAHVIGLCGANILIGTLCVWALHAWGILEGWVISPWSVVSLSCIGGVLMAIGSLLILRLDPNLASPVFAVLAREASAVPRYLRRFR